MTDVYAPPAFQFYARDFLALRDTMPPEQLVAWQSLRCLAWLAPTRGEAPCSLPSDDDSLARMSGLGPKWRKLGTAIKARFRVDGDRLIDDELLAYRSEIETNHVKKSRAGKAGADKRWGDGGGGTASTGANGSTSSRPIAGEWQNDSKTIALQTASASASAVSSLLAARARDPNADRTEVPPDTPPSASEAAIPLTVTANRAITNKWGEQTRPILAAAGSSTETAAALLADGIPLAFAQRSIAAQIEQSRKDRPMQSLAWFLGGIREDWASRAAQDAARAAPPPEAAQRPRRRPASVVAADAAHNAFAAANELLNESGGDIT